MYCYGPTITKIQIGENEEIKEPVSLTNDLKYKKNENYVVHFIRLLYFLSQATRRKKKNQRLTSVIILDVKILNSNYLSFF